MLIAIIVIVVIVALVGFVIVGFNKLRTTDIRGPGGARWHRRCNSPAPT